MKYPLILNEISYMAETAAISCIRYRSIYGISPLAEFAGVADGPKLKAKLAKLMFAMIQPEMSFEAFAGECINEPSFDTQAMGLRARLLAPDTRYKPKDGESVNPEAFDEFDMLARMSHTKVPESLIYELTLPQLQSVINRSLEYLQKAKNPKPQYVKMNPHEVADFFRGA